jgi:hypothetical protein
VTFENTPNRQKITTSTGLQILSQIKLMEVAGVKYVKEVIKQSVT